MTRELDRRNLYTKRLTQEKENKLKSLASELSTQLEGHIIHIKKFDELTGNPSIITSELAPAIKGNYVQRALQHIQTIQKVLGLDLKHPSEFVADPVFQETSSHAVAVHLQQYYQGIPIFQASQTVRFYPNGALQETLSNAVTVNQDYSPIPRISVQDAVLKAAKHVAVPHVDEQNKTDQSGTPLENIVDLTNFVPTIITMTKKADSSTVLESGPFGNKIKSSLIWFPLNDNLSLCWQVMIIMPRLPIRYYVMVDASTGEILYCKYIFQSVGAKGNIYHSTVTDPRKLTDFPSGLQFLSDYMPDDYLEKIVIPDDLPKGFPDTWVETDRSFGNNVHAFLYQGDIGQAHTPLKNGPDIQGTTVNGILTFDPSDPFGNDQRILNLFYYCNLMHDFFYVFGFRESDGCIQESNLGRNGSVSHRINAVVVDGPKIDLDSNGNYIMGFSLGPDDEGRLSIYFGPMDGTHAALEIGAIAHEYTHAVTYILICHGNLLNLIESQSQGIDEGLSFYFTGEMYNILDNTSPGVHNVPPFGFGNLGMTGYTERHEIGDIMSYALREMRVNIGANLSIHLVVDAMKLSPFNPSFLDMRDSILRALDHKAVIGELDLYQKRCASKGIWEAFTKYGMGPNAKSNGATLTGIISDTTMSGGIQSLLPDSLGSNNDANTATPVLLDLTGVSYAVQNFVDLNLHDGNDKDYFKVELKNMSQSDKNCEWLEPWTKKVKLAFLEVTYYFNPPAFSFKITNADDYCFATKIWEVTTAPYVMNNSDKDFVVCNNFVLYAPFHKLGGQNEFYVEIKNHLWVFQGATKYNIDFEYLSMNLGTRITSLPVTTIQRKYLERYFDHIDLPRWPERWVDVPKEKMRSFTARLLDFLLEPETATFLQEMLKEDVSTAVAQPLYEVGNVAQIMGMFEEAEKSYLKASKRYSKAGDKGKHVTVLENLYELYIERGMKTKADSIGKMIKQIKKNITN